MANWGRWAAGVATGGLSEAGRGFKKGIDEMREPQKPQQQYYGGSQSEYAHYQADYKSGVVDADQQAQAGVDRANAAANAAGERYGRIGEDVESYGNNQGREALQADIGFDQSMGNYQGGRKGVLDNAARLERDAGTLAQDYQQTADRQFQLNQARAARAAMAQGARGGASGLRTAIASNSAANADALAQAEIVRAQQYNDMAQQRRDAYAQAADIRSGQGAQDQNASQIYANRQQNAYGNQANAYAQRAGLVGDQNTAQQNAAQLQASTGVAQQGNYLGASTSMETAQLNAEREREAQRQQQRNTWYNRVRDPLGMHGS